MAEGFSPLALAGFELFFLPLMRSRVQTRIAPIPDLPPDRPVFFVANHSSWWDPFILREMHRRMRPEQPLYTLMLQSELEKHPFFRRIGIVGIDPASAGSVRRAIRTFQRRLERHPGACVTFFPQGRIWPATRRPLGFRRGIEPFVQALAPVTLLPVGIRVEPLNDLRPTAFTLPGSPIPATSGEGLAPRLEDEVVRLLDRIGSHVDEYGEDSARHWPPSPHPG